MHVRTSYGPYMDRVDKYLDKLIQLVKNMQFTVSGGKGPIIAVQVIHDSLFANFNIFLSSSFRKKFRLG